MSECRHDGWRVGCASCAEQEAIALLLMGEDDPRKIDPDLEEGETDDYDDD